MRFVAVTPGPYRTDNRQLALMADEPLSAVPHQEVLMVPGGFGTRALETPNPLLDWIRAAHETSQWTTSVCTGSMLLAASGILKELEATTHWMSLDRLPAYGARPTLKRVVEKGKVITAAGVSSGIDMALTLTARIAGDDVARPSSSASSTTRSRCAVGSWGSRCPRMAPYVTGMGAADGAPAAGGW